MIPTLGPLGVDVSFRIELVGTTKFFVTLNGGLNIDDL
jgi:hypothetical protein